MSVKGGRKIYRANSSYKKRKAQRVLKVFLGLIVIAALVFLGYCVARPVFEYLSDRNETSSAEDTAPWTPPKAPEEEDPAEDEDIADDNEAEQNEKEQQDGNRSAGFSAYRLPVSALGSAAALNEELSNAKEGGYTAVMAVLKDKGGKIYYKTASDLAKSDETAIVGDMYAGQICSMIRAAGFIPIAEINILEDNNRYGMNRDGSYHIASDNSAWLDNSPANGGKPWLSPFDEKTISYAGYLSDEVSLSGFDYVIFSGLVFPDFRNSDLNYIGDIVRSADRYKALINIGNVSAEASSANGSVPIVMISAGDILSGKAEVFRPSELSAETIAVSYAPSEIEGTAIIAGQETALADLAPYERAKLVFEEISRLAGNDKTIIPLIKRSELGQADLNDIISAAIDSGMDSYIVM